MEITIKVEVGLSQELRAFVADALAAIKPAISQFANQPGENPAPEGKGPEMERRLRRTRHHYSEEESEFLYNAYKGGLPYDQIACEFNGRFGTKITTAAAYRQCYNIAKGKV